MCRKLYAGIIVLIAVVLAVLVNNVPIDYIDNVMFVVKFFEVMLPVLGVGALILYLYCGHGHKHCKSKCDCSCGKCCCGKKGHCAPEKNS